MNRVLVLIFLVLFGNLLPGPAQDLRSQVTPEVLAADSTHFMEYGGSPSLERQVALPENQNKDLVVVTRTVGDRPLTGMPDGSVRSWLATKAANADLVVLATPLKRHSALTADHSFVFSDYEVCIEQVLKDVTGQVFSGNIIVVARAGGVTTVNGHPVRAIDPEFRLFRLGEQYLFFLYQIPNMGTFKAFADESFLISGDRAIPAKTHPGKFAQDFRSRPAFLQLVQDAVSFAAERERARQ